MCEIVKKSVAEGAKVVVGGKAKQGLFYEPTVLTECTRTMPVIQQEIFGPVVAVMTFETEEEAMEIANSSDKGLAGQSLIIIENTYIFLFFVTVICNWLWVK